LPDHLPAELATQAEAHLVEEAREFGPRERTVLGRKGLDVVAPEIGAEPEPRPVVPQAQHAHRAPHRTSQHHCDGPAPPRSPPPPAPTARSAPARPADSPAPPASCPPCSAPTPCPSTSAAPPACSAPPNARHCGSATTPAGPPAAPFPPPGAKPTTSAGPGPR